MEALYVIYRTITLVVLCLLIYAFITA